VVAPLELRALARCCGEIAQLRPRTVVIAGGDGTVMQVLSSLRRAYAAERLPQIVVLPFGTINTMVRHWVGTGDPWQLLAQCMADHGQLRPQRTLRVDLDGVEHVAATLGAGLVSHFFDEYERSARRGFARAIGIFSRVFFGSMIGSGFARQIFQADPGTLVVDGRVRSVHAFSLLVCSVFENVGLGLRPTYRASMTSEKIHLVATDLEARLLGPQAWRVLLGKRLVAARLVDELVNEFALRFDAETSLILDGERMAARHVVVRPGEDLLVWTPRQR
jgi:diacylglycerol kinase family enzyme